MTMTNELKSDLKKFNKIINPDNIKCYHRKTHFKGNIPTEEATYISLDEYIMNLEEGDQGGYGIDLSLLDAFFIDCDNQSDVEKISRLLEDVDSIQVETSKGHRHFYLRYDKRIVPGIIHGTSASIHDWFQSNTDSPYAPIVPGNNNRKFISIPEKLDKLPENINIYHKADVEPVVIDSDNGIEMCTFKTAYIEGYNIKKYLFLNIKEVQDE